MAPENAILRREKREQKKLQWGRGRMAPENARIARAIEMAGFKLQWGRGRMAPENTISGGSMRVQE